MLTIGPYKLDNALILAPMAGVTDLPFRRLCKHFKAGLVVSEMLSANPELRQSQKTRWRMDHTGECSPISVQIAGGDPEQLAEAARYNVDHGAQIIDINMGCPAKKVCRKAAGSALLKDERLVAAICTAVVKAVNVPVTLKIRTGWDTQTNNAITIAKIAEEAGIQCLAIHGRSRACKFNGEAEYDTIAAVKAMARIPIIANGDITDPLKAKRVLMQTGADGLMIGRAAQGRPWIFTEILSYLETGQLYEPPTFVQIKSWLLEHVQALHQFYGEFMGLRIARKHVGWTVQCDEQRADFRQVFNQITCPEAQLRALDDLN